MNRYGPITIDYSGLIPDKFYPYIKHRNNTLIANNDMPDNMKREFDEFRNEYNIIFPYLRQHKTAEKELTLKELWFGRRYNGIPEKIMKHVLIQNDTIIKKKDFPQELNEEYDFWKCSFETDIRYYRYMKYYLGFSPKYTLNLFQHILVLLKKKRYYIFY